jgi:hypothetical protein
LLERAALPSKWISEQAVADASQKLTWPAVTGVAPAATVAVRVTTVPGATDETGLPPEVKVSEVVVAGGTPHKGSVPELLAP